MKILNRFTGRMIHEAEAETMRELVKDAVAKGISLRWANLEGADLRGADLRGANLRGANLEGADLRGANLRGADLRGAKLAWVNLEGVNLEGAKLTWANLKGANLKGAKLKGANLEGADLRGANLEGADLEGTCIVDIGQRADGYQFYLHCGLDEPHILAGCRYMPVADARAHWRKTRGGTPLGKESLRMVSDGVARAAIRLARDVTEHEENKP